MSQSIGDSKLKDLRWTTLGYHHNWDSKKYDEKKTGSVPDILKELAEVIQKLTKNDAFKAEASICNYYPAGIGTIGIHTDNSGKVNRFLPVNCTVFLNLIFYKNIVMLLSFLFLLDVMVYFYWEKEIEVMNVSRYYFVTVICLLWMGRIDLHFMLCREF